MPSLYAAPKPLFAYRKYWAKRFGIAPVFPMSREEMDALGWDACDIILVSGDAYIDHPSFGTALIGRLLEAQGFRVGVIAQPDWHSKAAFSVLGKPTLFFGVSAGNMDSMVNLYTADRKIRSEDAYTPNAEPNKRPERASIVYAQRCREAYPDSVIVMGSIEASLRRLAHYDYWSDKVRRSVLPDAKADILVYGNAERAIVELSHRLAQGESIASIRDLRGTAFMLKSGEPIAPDWQLIDAQIPDKPVTILPPQNPYEASSAACETASTEQQTVQFHPREKRKQDRLKTVIRLPAYEAIKDNPLLYAHASRTMHLESNPGNARALVQSQGQRDVWVNPPPIPLTTEELDGVYALPFSRKPHPAYGDAKIPAYEMIRFSVNILRGCFGGCTFCSITAHEGRIVQSRSEASILQEIDAIREKTPGYTGVISDLGGPTANMYRMTCKDPHIEAACRRLSCVHPEICPNLGTDHGPLIALYGKARSLPHVKRILIGSGIRYDLALRSPEYIKTLATHHVGGYLKVAPEHTEARPLSLMMKPSIGSYEAFKALFERYSKEAGKEQYLIPYFIAAHPGTEDEDMLKLALWLKEHNLRVDQVQTFLPTPMAMASTMYHTGINLLKRVGDHPEKISTVKTGQQRRRHKAFLRYHDPENFQTLRDALRQMGRSDLIGNSKKHLVPAFRALPSQSVKEPLTKGTRRTPKK